jgi:hypothetical protein
MRPVRFVLWALLMLVGCSSGGSSPGKKADASAQDDGGTTTGGSGKAGTGNATGAGGKAGSGGKGDAGGAGGAGDKGGSDGAVGTGGAGGAGGTGGTGETSSAPTCASLGCVSPATCDESGSAPKCACPSGYKLTGGTSCTDIDECADSTLHNCAAHATCTNKAGGFDCACNGPIYTGDGTTCGCAAGYSLVSGDCLADDGQTCSAGTDCGTGHCVSGICCASACDAPPNCKVATGATCAGGSTCVYGTGAADGSTCDDGNACTQTDTCQSGTCTGSNPKTCTARDQCHVAGTCDPSTGCSDPNQTDGTACNDGLACTPTDTCQAGVCHGSSSNPCGAGLGTCAESSSGPGYTCACNSGYMAVDGTNDSVSNPTCACDMNGTFVVQVTTTESWTGIQFIQNASMVTSKAWSIRTQTYDASGMLTVTTDPCGGTSPDLCGTGTTATTPDLAAEAYAAFAPNSIWGTASMPHWSTPAFSITNALPGQAYVEPMTAALLGITLTDPFGAWPASRQNVLGGTGTRTNGAAWDNADGDTDTMGVTLYDVPPGGVLSATSPFFPPEDYGSSSTACPRGTGNRLPYAYAPVPTAPPPSTTFDRVKRFSSASRTISQLSGTISSCDLITGDVLGPDSGKQHTDGRIASCVIVSGSGEAACSSAEVTSLDGPSSGTHTWNTETFIAKRVTGATPTCAAVRAMTFP